MQRAIRAITLCAGLLACVHARAEEYEANDDTSLAVGGEIDVGTFHERLSPYGRWVYVAPYGEVWVPRSAVADFRPYYDGRWVLTEYGWTFVSDDPWGWATWHYGNWVMAESFGWVWIPGVVWAPAWVTWRHGGGYACWAPAAPIGYGVVYAASSPAWVAVEERHLAEPVSVRHAAVPASQTATYVSRAQELAPPTRVGTVAVNPGPHPAAVSAATGRPVQPVAARAVTGRGTDAIATAPLAPRPPEPVQRVMEHRGWNIAPTAPAERSQSMATPTPMRQPTMQPRPPATGGIHLPQPPERSVRPQAPPRHPFVAPGPARPNAPAPATPARKKKDRP